MIFISAFSLIFYLRFHAMYNVIVLLLFSFPCVVLLIVVFAIRCGMKKEATAILHKLLDQHWSENSKKDFVIIFSNTFASRG